MANILLYISHNRRPMIFGYAAACTQFVFWASVAEWSLYRENENEYIFTGLASITSLAIPVMIQFYLSRRVKSVKFMKDLQHFSIQSQALGTRPELYPSAALRTTESVRSSNPSNFDLILRAERHGRKAKVFLIDRTGSFPDKMLWDNVFLKS